MNLEEFLVKINFMINSNELTDELINMFVDMFKNKKIISEVITTKYERDDEVITLNTTKLKNNKAIQYKLLEGTFESNEFNTYTFSIEKFGEANKTLNGSTLPSQLVVKTNKNGEILKLIKFDMSYDNNCLRGSKVKYENDNGVINEIKYETSYDENSSKLMEQQLGKNNLYSSRIFSYDFDNLNIVEGIENIEPLNKKQYMSSMSEEKTYRRVKKCKVV